MSRDYSDHYAVGSWFDGEGDCDPPEPGKEWLTVEEDGEELCILVLRRAAFADEAALTAGRAEREERAQRIVNALNFMPEPF